MRISDWSSDVCSSDLDKIMTKKIWVQQGLPTPEFAILATRADLAGAIARLGLPLIVKPPHEGSTVGVTKVTEQAALEEAWRLAARYDADVLAESFVAGRELTVPLPGTGRPTGVMPLVESIARPEERRGGEGRVSKRRYAWCRSN